MPFTVATWNINSVRLREALVDAPPAPSRRRTCSACRRASARTRSSRPRPSRRSATTTASHGQKGYNGVAILSRLPFEDAGSRDFGGVGHARHQSAACRLGERRIRIHNFYVPAGGDVPDRDDEPEVRPEARLPRAAARRVRPTAEPGVSAILVGDLNIAPLEDDVWSHKQLLKIVATRRSRPRRSARHRRTAAGSISCAVTRRRAEKLYTWWSYRAPDWAAADKGRRLDHVWGIARPRAALARPRGPEGRPRLGPPVRPRAGARHAGFLNCGVRASGGRAGHRDRRRRRSTAPPSGLPAISPSRGEIGSFGAGSLGDALDETDLPP